MAEQDKIIQLLEENNRYLRQLLELKQKEHREMVWGQIFHALTALLPFIVVAVLGYMAWQSINSYLDVLNTNINTLKTNFDLLRDFFQKLIPDFSDLMPQLKNTWESVQFWK